MNLTVEGELTELFYVAPKGRTALEVQRNYENALKGAGARLLYTCLGKDYGCYSGGGPANELLFQNTVPEQQQIKTNRGAFTAFDYTSTNLRLSVFTLPQAGVDTYVTVYSVDVPSDIGI